MSKSRIEWEAFPVNFILCISFPYQRKSYSEMQYTLRLDYNYHRCSFETRVKSKTKDQWYFGLKRHIKIQNETLKVQR